MSDKASSAVIVVVVVVVVVVVAVSSCGETSGVVGAPVTPPPELEALEANIKSGYAKKSTARIPAPTAIEPPMKIASDFAMPGAARHNN
ncbi:MAG TPA: hypothetical protein VNI77_01970 [Nitrososphaera sp.]|nr:hypothetical protein [Nitrososphaera sp.]